jgi:hypothetical protein
MGDCAAMMMVADEVNASGNIALVLCVRSFVCMLHVACYAIIVIWPFLHSSSS